MLGRRYEMPWRRAYEVYAGIAWWLARESPEARQHTRTRARQATAQAQDARPSLYRWRDDAGVLQITDHPPKGRRYERLDRALLPI